MVSDLRLAIRQLLKAPGFSAIVVVTLALAIGACTAVVSVFNGILINPVGEDPHPEREVHLYETQLPKVTASRVSAANFLDWEKQAKSFDYMRAGAPANLVLNDANEPIRLIAARATHNLVPAHYWSLAYGRGFTPEDDKPGSEKVILVSHRIWKNHLGGDPTAVGRPVRINGEPYRLVGVLSEEVGRYSGADAFVPMAFTDQDRANRRTRSYGVWARLKPGVTLEQARAEMNVIAAQLAQQYPDANRGWGVSLVTSVEEQAGGGLSGALWTLLAAVGCVLLIACANVANLLLARATARQQEMAVRVALGAGRHRLIRLLFAEGLVLALAGGAAGVLLAHWGLQLVHGYGGVRGFPGAGGMKRLAYIELDWTMLLVALGVSLLTAVVFGLAPAWFIARVNLSSSLKQGSRGTTEAGGRGRLRNSLVVVEVALTIVLLAAAGGLIRRLGERAALDPGFVAANAVAMQVNLPKAGYPQPERQLAFAEAVLGRMRGLPGVQAAGAATALPTGQQLVAIHIDGQPSVAWHDRPRASYAAISPDFFPAMGIRVIRGRGFTVQDHAQGQRVAVINETMAKRYFSNEDPLGKRITIAQDGFEGARVIVGIARDVTHFGAGTDITTPPQLYDPLPQSPGLNLSFVVRVSGELATVMPLLKPQVYALDKNQPVMFMRPLQEIIDERVAGQRFIMHLLTVFSGVGVIIAAVGIYAVVAYTVAQRTMEIGIRIALGADQRDVLRLVMKFGARVVGLGLVVGIVAALTSARVIQSMLYQVNARDPLTLGAIVGLLALTALLACILPARRAMRVNPLIALRSE